MKRRTVTKISVLLLIGIGLFVIYRVFDFGSYVLLRNADAKQYADIEKGSNERDAWFTNLARIGNYSVKNDLKESLELIDSLALITTNTYPDSKIDLLLKRAFVNYKLNNQKAAEEDFQKVINLTSMAMGDQVLIKEEKEQYYYGTIGLMLSNHKVDQQIINKYIAAREEHYIKLSLDSVNNEIQINIDSIIAKQIYNVDDY